MIIPVVCALIHTADRKHILFRKTVLQFGETKEESLRRETGDLEMSQIVEGPTFEIIAEKKHYIQLSFLCQAEQFKAKALQLDEGEKRLLSWFNQHGFIGFEKQKIRAKIGVNSEEKLSMQEVHLSLRALYDMRKAIAEDHIDRAIDYAAVLEHCKQVACSRHFDLLETLAHEITQKLFHLFPIEEIDLTIEKPKALFGKKSYVQLLRRRS